MLLLFDVDGTLCNSGEIASSEMIQILTKLKNKYTLGIVGGGKYEKIKHQFSDKLYDIFTYVFTESGIINYKNNIKIYEDDIRNKINITKINNILLKYLCDLDLPIKTGTFIDLRRGLIYFTPIGQNCTTQDRSNFILLDKKNNIRQKIIKDLSKLLPELEIMSGGEIGLSISPKGWNKSFVLRFLKKEKNIIFFGDKIYPGGNDYPLAIQKEINKYHQVNNYNETIQIILDKYL